MNCAECKELLVGYVEGFLDESQKQTVAGHLNSCRSCLAESDAVKGLHKRLVTNGRVLAQTALENDVMNRIVREQSVRLKTTNKISTGLKIRRIIMKNPIVKLAVAAVVLIGISVVGWFSYNPNVPKSMSSFALLANAYAAEKTLFCDAGGIVHIANEIVLYPVPERDTGELLRELESGVTEDKNLNFLKSWLSYSWFPIHSLGADGRQRDIKLNIAKHADEKITVSDIAWYDPATGRFARVLRTGDQVLFANAYDGEAIYVASIGPDDVLQINREAVTGKFRVPNNPADFLGIAAGIKGSVPREHYPPIQDVTTETLQDGTPVSVYKLGFTDPWGKVDTYFLFKINTNTDVIGEIECVVKGKTTRVHRRVVAETVDSPEFSWNLSELTAGPAKQTSVNANAIEGARIVTVKQMAQRATSTVYIFAENPSWTDDCKIYDLPDEASPSARFFAATYHAKDGRDITLTQGESFTRYFSATFAKIQELGEQSPWAYESKNGFKALHQSDGGDKKGEMYWTEFALKSSGFEPTANRVGYILMSPAKTFLTLAINGPVSEQELQGLVDSLVPADEYVPSSVQP
jgi:hypothetical protein